MASRGYTTPDNLPYPNNPNDQADLPPENRSLAEAVQAALNNKIGVARRIIAGNGLLATPAETLAQDLTLSVRTKSPIYIDNDQVAIDPAASFPHSHPEYSPIGHTHSNLGQVIASSTWVGDYQISAAAFSLGTIGPGAEATAGPFGINPGTYCICSMQHPSTYLQPTYNDLGNGTATIKVRNSTTSTTHTNVKVHALFINLPG